MKGASQSRGRASIGDVAARAGVSLGTVSHVLNHPDRVTPSTRERVEAAIVALRYVPNSHARSLAAGTSRMLGLVVTDLYNSLFVDIARGAEIGAETAGMSLMLANSDNDRDQLAVHLATFGQVSVAGVLLTLNSDDSLALVERTSPENVPVVVLNHAAPTSRFCSVSVDNELGGYMATTHLLERGRTRVAFVGGPDALRPVHDRRLGLLRALEERGMKPAREYVPGEIRRADGWAVGQQLAADVRAGDVDAVFAVSDLLAAGIAQALSAQSDIRVPDDVAIVGYDNNQAAWDSPIPITTIGQPGEEVGRLGAELVQLERPGHQHVSTVLAPSLVVRVSS